MGPEGKEEETGKRRGRGNHNQDIIYEKKRTIFNKRKKATRDSWTRSGSIGTVRSHADLW